MTITAVGSLAKTSSAKTLAVSPTATGDILVLAVVINITTAAQVDSVSGGGVTSWARLIKVYPSTNTGGAELWWGVVTSTGSSTITVTSSTISAGNVAALGSQQFHSTGTPVWGADGSGAGSSATTAAASGNYPSVTPAGSGELYLGAAHLVGGSPGGSSSGFVYDEGSGSFEGASQFVYNLSGPSPSAPPWTQASGYWAAVSAFLTTTGTPPPTSSGLLDLF